MASSITPISRNRYRPRLTTDATQANVSSPDQVGADGGPAGAGDVPQEDGQPNGNNYAYGNSYQGGFTNQTDPGAMAQQNRMLAAGMGAGIEQGAVQAQNQYGGQEQNFMNQAQGAYQQLAQTPGYNDQEAKQIGQDYSQYRTPDSQLQQQYLTGQEQQGIQGNPNAGFQQLNPKLISGMTGQYQQAANQAVGDLQQGLQGAVQTSQGTSPSASYQNAANGAVSGAQSGLNAAANNPNLQLDQGFQNRQMTDQDVQNITTAAGRTAGNQYRSAISDMQRAAAANGETSPMAVADMRDRMERQSAASSGEASAQANIAAKQSQFDRAGQIEQMRLGSSQDISSRQMSAAGQGGQMALGQANTAEQMRQNAQQFQTGTQYNAALAGNQAAINQANTGQQQMQNVEEFNQGNAAQYAQAGDAASSSRAAQLAGNRQQTTQGIQSTQYQQGTQTGQLNSQGQQTLGQARMAGQQEGRQFLTGEQQLAQQGRQNAAQNQIQGAQATNQGVGQAANTAVGNVGAQKAPGTGMQIFSTLANALFADGGIATQPTSGIVGEDGPEWVGPADQAQQPGMWQRLGQGVQFGMAQRFDNSPAGKMWGAWNSGQSPQPTSGRQPLGPTLVGAMRNRYRQGAAGGTSVPDPAGASEAAEAPEGMNQGRIVTKPTYATLAEDGRPEAVVPLAPRANPRVPGYMIQNARNRYRA